MRADSTGNGGPPRRRRDALRRWFAILLPIVFGLRAILLVFQLHSEHHRVPEPPPPPPWPPSPGQTLRFDAGSRAIADRAAGPRHDPLPAGLLEKNYVAMPPDTGCMLDPAAMARHGGGSLTVVSRDAGGDWLVRWSGSSTMPSLDETGAGDGPPAERRMEIAALDAADCGFDSRLQLTTPVLHVLVNMLAGLPPPPLDRSAPSRELHIRVEQPTPR